MPDSSATAEKRRAVSPSAASGVIRTDEMYLVDEARRRLRIGQWAWRQWRRDGLVVLRVSGRAFVMGSDLIEFIQQRSRETKGTGGSQGHY